MGTCWLLPLLWAPTPRGASPPVPATHSAIRAARLKSYGSATRTWRRTSAARPARKQSSTSAGAASRTCSNACLKASTQARTVPLPWVHARHTSRARLAASKGVNCARSNYCKRAHVKPTSWVARTVYHQMAASPVSHKMAITARYTSSLRPVRRKYRSQLYRKDSRAAGSLI